MRIVTAQEMQELDHFTINKLGISSQVLMENAGVAVVRALEEEFSSLVGKRINIVAGTGNNGGDGFVIARHLLNKESRVRIFLVGKGKLSKDCHHNMEVFQRLDGEVQLVDHRSLEKLKFTLSMGDLIVDALLGTGFTGELRGLLPRVVDIINNVKRPVVAVDIPSGVNGTTGYAGHAVKADLTVTLGFMKQGLLLYPGRELCGKIKVVDIGIPTQLAAAHTNKFLTTDSVCEWLPNRPCWGHKGTFGHVLVVAGSASYAGAAYLSSMACLRAGAGVVSVAIPQKIASRMPANELIVTPVPDTPQGTFGHTSIDMVRSLMVNKDVLVLGCGLSQEQEIHDFVRELLMAWQGSLVLDADGLNSLSTQKDLILQIPSQKRAQWVLTPHPGEMARFVQLPVEDVNHRRIEEAWSAYEAYGVNIVLKGAPTVIAGEDGVYLNNSGNHGMGTAGMGDVLAGIIGGLMAQGMSAYQAAVTGVYYHGKAGDLAVETTGSRGLIASDVLNSFSKLL